MDSTKSNKITIPEMLQTLDELYVKEEALVNELERLIKLYNQLQDDKEMMQNFIMYQSNKLDRGIKI